MGLAIFVLTGPAPWLYLEGTAQQPELLHSTSQHGFLWQQTLPLLHEQLRPHAVPQAATQPQGLATPPLSPSCHKPTYSTTPLSGTAAACGSGSSGHERGAAAQTAAVHSSGNVNRNRSSGISVGPMRSNPLPHPLSKPTPHRASPLPPRLARGEEQILCPSQCPLALGQLV